MGLGLSSSSWSAWVFPSILAGGNLATEKFTLIRSFRVLTRVHIFVRRQHQRLLEKRLFDFIVVDTVF